MLAFAAEHGAGKVLQGRIGIAVAEAAADAVVHAYDSPVSGNVEVAVVVEDDDLEVVVADTPAAGIEVWMRFHLGAER